MLNGPGTHYSIDSSVCHSTASTKRHALSNCGSNSSKDGATATLSRSRRRSLAHWLWWVSYWSSSRSRAGCRPS
uniref:Uncharacterized protein n=1 Tax=Arundo donax TaxID=35708 RepID=A0A0A9F6T3_ARUDO